MSGRQLDHCLLGHYCLEGEPNPQPCAAGLLGNSTSFDSASCGGVCPQGYFCPRASSAAEPCAAGTYGMAAGLRAASECTRTPAGFFSSAGSAQPSKCGGSSLYCPGGNARPQPVNEMHAETYTDLALNPLLDPADASTRTSYRSCRPGFYCESGQAIRCPLGHWCRHGTQHECGAGTMGNAPQLDSPACNGQCIQSHFCPPASTAAEVCPEGRVGERLGLQYAAQCDDCPAGYWCNSGKKFQCAKGYYTASDAPSSARTDLDACEPCPPHSTTREQASATIRACVCDAHYYRNGNQLNATCLPCPTGTSCEAAGTTLTSLPVVDTFWKPGSLSVIAKPCPFRR